MECHIPDHSGQKVDLLVPVKTWLERKERESATYPDYADDTQLFFGRPEETESSRAPIHEGSLGYHIPEYAHGSILLITRNKQADCRLGRGKTPIGSKVEFTLRSYLG